MKNIINCLTRAELGLLKFNLNYYQQNKPVVVQNGISDWNALTKWSPQYLKSILGAKDVVIRSNEQGIFDNSNEPATGPVHILKTKFANAIDLILTDTASKHYLQQTAVYSTFPELIPDISTPYLLDITKRAMYTNLWISSEGSKTPLHYDSPENFLIQVSGRKRVTLFPPDVSNFLYPFDEGERSRINIFGQDLAEFPLLERAKAKQLQYDMQPGNLLYIPRGWWHAVESLETSLSINTFWVGKGNLLVKWILPRFFSNEPFLEMRW